MVTRDQARSRFITQKRQMFKNRHQAKINGLKIQCLKKQLHVRKEKTSGRIFREPLGLETKKDVTSNLKSRRCRTLGTFAHTNGGR
jgi:hypothetical protein